MLSSRVLVIVLVAEVFGRPDVSHLLTQNKQPVTSYDVPVSSVNNKYVSSSHTFRKEQEVPLVSYLPPFVNQQNAIQGSGPSVVSNVAHGTGAHQVHYVSQTGQQVPIAILGGSSSSGQQQFVSNLGQSQGNVQYVTQSGGGHGQGNVQYVSQVGQGGVNFVSQGGHSGGSLGFSYRPQLVKNHERVYYFSAPEELEHLARLRINIVPTHTKNSNVIFVKAPSTGKIIPEVVVPPHQIVEDKTKVVVLVKENEEYVPISVPAPVPISQGKAEVLVVKYHDKNDASRVVASGGNAIGTTLVQHHDKPSFINTIGNVQYGNTGTLVSRFNSGDSKIDTSSISTGVSNTNSDVNLQEVSKSLTGVVNKVGSGLHSVEIVNTTPKIQTYPTETSYVSSGLGGNVESGKTEYQIIESIPSLENIKIAQNLQGGAIKGETQYEIKSVNDGQLINNGNNYEIKSLISENSPSYNFQNVGTQLVGNAGQQLFDTRFNADNFGSSGLSGYTVKTTEILQDGPQAHSLSSDNLDSVKKLLGGGIEIVSVSKGVLEGSGVGSEAQNAVLKSLGISEGSYGGIGQGVSGFEIKQGRSGDESFLQSSSSQGILGNTQQIKIGNDVADIISGSSLN